MKDINVDRREKLLVTKINTCKQCRFFDNKYNRHRCDHPETIRNRQNRDIMDRTYKSIPEWCPLYDPGEIVKKTNATDPSVEYKFIEYPSAEGMIDKITELSSWGWKIKEFIHASDGYKVLFFRNIPSKPVI